jgi:hypothetical protein
MRRRPTRQPEPRTFAEPQSPDPVAQRAWDSESGNMGHVERTDIPCAACRSLGRTTYGGYTPTLVQREAGGPLFCTSAPH